VILIVLALALAAQSYERFHLSNAAFGRMGSSAFDRCEREARNTYDARQCIWAEQRRTDGRLNAAYRGAMARLPDASSRRDLRNLERQWVTTRWNECRRRVATLDGTINLINEDFCALREMARRAAWLERYRR